MIIGAHVMLKSKNDIADKAFLTDVLKLSSIDAGEGFLIFGLPPTEVAVHESEQNDAHELYLMCESIEAFVAEMQRLGVPATPPVNQGWGTLTEVMLPGGGKLSVYEPHHARPEVSSSGTVAKKKAPKKKAKTPIKKSVKKTVAKNVPKKKAKTPTKRAIKKVSKKAKKQ